MLGCEKSAQIHAMSRTPDAESEIPKSLAIRRAIPLAELVARSTRSTSVLARKTSKLIRRVGLT
jgi:hypothetical protein